MKSKRSKATDISKAVKEKVWERDKGRCIFCGSNDAMPNAHVISRAYGGLGVEQNIVTACLQCHFNMDNSPKRKSYRLYAIKYLKRFYPDWKEEEVTYERHC